MEVRGAPGLKLFSLSRPPPHRGGDHSGVSCSEHDARDPTSRTVSHLLRSLLRSSQLETPRASALICGRFRTKTGQVPWLVGRVMQPCASGSGNLTGGAERTEGCPCHIHSRFRGLPRRDPGPSYGRVEPSYGSWGLKSLGFEGPRATWNLWKSCPIIEVLTAAEGH